MRDYGKDAQAAAEAHLEQCELALEQEQMTGSDALWPEDMAGPYCGCPTCMVREILHAAWPWLQLAIEQKIQTPKEGDAR